MMAADIREIVECSFCGKRFGLLVATGISTTVADIKIYCDEECEEAYYLQELDNDKEREAYLQKQREFDMFLSKL